MGVACRRGRTGVRILFHHQYETVLETEPEQESGQRGKREEWIMIHAQTMGRSLLSNSGVKRTTSPL